VALDRRGEPHGVRAFSVHPGAVVTDLMRHMTGDEATDAVERTRQVAGLKTTEQGAAASVWCATSKQLDGKGGVYCEDVDIAEAVPGDSPDPGGVRPWATDPALAERLWILSEAWTVPLP
jgi:NAD(P)-dependent dehydrogenase (short-subunit alcohol dehydrogenase family)